MHWLTIRYVDGQTERKTNQAEDRKGQNSIQ